MISEGISIIITTRNNSSVLPTLLESISRQTMKDYELIVVDNHSTDGTQGIAMRYEARLMDAGPERSAQRNAGAEKAEGKFLLFLDSDV